MPWCTFLATLAASLLGLNPCADAPRPTAATVMATAVQRTEALQSVHFRLEVTRGTVQLGPGLAVVRAAGEVERPDRLRVRATTSMGSILVTTDIVHYDGDGYVLNPFTRRWERMGGAFTPVPLLDAELGVPALMRAAFDLRLDDQESVEGTPTWRVTGKVTAEAVTAVVGGTPVRRNVDLEALVGDDGLVHRLVLRGPISQGEAADITRRLDFSQFDTAPPVVRPSSTSAGIRR